MPQPRSRRDAVARIERLLDKERTVILSGVLDPLGGLIDKREALTDDLAGTIDRDDGAAIAALARVQKKAARNAELIRAAIEGMTAANETIARTIAARATLSTYSASGQIENVVRPEARLTRRA